MERYSEKELSLIEASYKSFLQSVKGVMDEEQLRFIDKAYRLVLDK